MTKSGFIRMLTLALGALPTEPSPSHEALDAFLSESDLRVLLRQWLDLTDVGKTPPSRNQLLTWLCADIAFLDQWLNDHVNRILHHPRFQRVEATWRGLTFLIQQQPADANIQIRVLNASWRELTKDAEQAIEFDQSELFQKIYEDEFGTPGGYPFGLILADFELRHRSSADYPFDDFQTLTSLARAGAGAFAPVIFGAHPHLFELDSFEGLDRQLELERSFSQLSYLQADRFRKSDDARFVGVTLPRVLMRAPYRHHTRRTDHFPFEEDVCGFTNEKYLWGTAVYCLGATAMRAFATTGWFEEMIGVSSDGVAGGMVHGLATDWFDTEQDGVATKIVTDARLSVEDETSFSAQGFISLCHCNYTNVAMFHTCPSLHRPQLHDHPAANRNAELSTKLNLVLCVSRFAHYLKFLVRDQVGHFMDANRLEHQLTRWIQHYVSADPSMAPAVRARFPLSEASIRVNDVPGRPGTFMCVAHLRPHLQTDYAVTRFQLATEIPGRGRWVGTSRSFVPE